MRETTVAILAILSITGLAALALLQGINGSVLLSSFTIIGGLGGYSIGKRRGKSDSSAKKLPQPHNDMVK